MHLSILLSSSCWSLASHFLLLSPFFYEMTSNFHFCFRWLFPSASQEALPWISEGGPFSLPTRPGGTVEKRVGPSDRKQYFSCSVGFAWMLRRLRAGDVPASWAGPAVAVGRIFHIGCHYSPLFSHLPRSDRSGLSFVLSLARRVHGRMCTDIKRAFSSGENCTRGILAKDHVGR